MIAQHGRIARLLAEHLGLPEAVLESLRSAKQQWDARGWPGAMAGPGPWPRPTFAIARRLAAWLFCGGATRCMYLYLIRRVLATVRPPARPGPCVGGVLDSQPALAEVQGREGVDHDRRLLEVVDAQ